MGIDVPMVDWDKKNTEVRDHYFVAHELMIADFRVTLHLASRPLLPGLRDLPYRDGAKQRKITPDWSFTLLDGGDRLDYYLEADRSTMTTGDYLLKLRAYWLYFTQKQEAFRVLTVCKSEARVRNLVTIARQIDSPFFWFTTADSTHSRLFESIWQTPADDATHHLLE